MDCPTGASQFSSESSVGGSFAGPVLVEFLGFGLLELRFVHSLIRLSTPSEGGLTLKNDRLEYFFHHLDLYLDFYLQFFSFFSTFSLVKSLSSGCCSSLIFDWVAVIWSCCWFLISFGCRLVPTT